MRAILSFAAAVAFTALAGPALADGHGEQVQAESRHCTLSARQVVERFIPLFYEQKNVTQAFERWVDPGYIQHNPNAATGRKAAVDFLQPFFDANPGLRFTVYRVIASDGLVAVHQRMQIDENDRGNAVVDLFRVENCKIVEHWDVMQPVPETSANENGMF